MRTLCDVCEAAPAKLFCAADEAALCAECDAKVHNCNKLASRHVRLELAEARAVPRCDICENAPAFFYCGVDGTSLCLQCDMDVHIGGKKAHERYLLMGQRVELPKSHEGPANLATLGGDANHIHQQTNLQSNGALSSDTPAVAIAVGDIPMDEGKPVLRPSRMIDLNYSPHQDNICKQDVQMRDKEEDMTDDDQISPQTLVEQ